MSLRRFGPLSDRRAEPPFVLVALVVGGLVASRFLALAASPGEIDEAVFAGAVTHYDLFDLSPQAPGFPFWILIGRLLLPFSVTPFNALATASTLLSALAIPAFFVWGKRMVGGWAALGAAVFAAALPVVWVNGGRAFSDTPATSLFLLSLACLVVADERRSPNQTRWRELIAARHARRLAAAAGLLAAAGAGVRPHLLLGFGPLLVLAFLRIGARAHRRDAAATFAGVFAAGTLAWGAWLFAQAGGVTGLFASLTERAEFRSHAFATGTFGTLLDSFVVRDYLRPEWAAAFWIVFAIGAAALFRRRIQGAVDLWVVLVPLFLSLWFLHSRAMSRYSVPFAMIASLVASTGARAILRKGPVAFLATSAAAAFFAREAFREIRWSSREATPAMAAIESLERYTHPGRESLVVDGAFHPFLRTERWQGRLVVWGYTDSEVASAPRQFNKRLVRLADFTSETDSPDADDPAWRVFRHDGLVGRALGNDRLLHVAVRDPAPPLFGVGFGVRESVRGRPSFRWSGPSARLIVPGLDGPPVALLSGERAGDAGPTGLTVTDSSSGRVMVARTIAPGRFELAIVPPPVFGPMPSPREYLIACDRPAALPPVAGASRPKQGCFTFLESTLSLPPETLWERQGGRASADVGSRRDGRVDPEGFWAREIQPKVGIDFRWTTERASVVWVPLSGFTPERLLLKARPPGKEPVDVAVEIGDVRVGTLFLSPGDFRESALELDEAAVSLLTGPDPVRITFLSPTWVPKQQGAGDDTRALGIAVDRITFEAASPAQSVP